MNKFENGYEAAVAITSLDDIKKFEGSSAILVSTLVSILVNELNTIMWVDIRHDKDLRDRLNFTWSLAHLVAATGFKVSEGKVSRDTLKKRCAALFRCAADIQDDLNDRARHDWDVSKHWEIAAGSRDELDTLRGWK